MESDEIFIDRFLDILEKIGIREARPETMTDSFRRAINSSMYESFFGKEGAKYAPLEFEEMIKRVKSK